MSSNKQNPPREEIPEEVAHMVKQLHESGEFSRDEITTICNLTPTLLKRVLKKPRKTRGRRP